MNGEWFFPASLSPGAKLLTLGVGFGVFLGLPLAMGVIFAIAFNDWEALLLPVPFFAIMGVVQAVRTRGYGLGPDGVKIHRLIGPIVIGPDQIERVRTRPDAPRAPLHLCALRGFYGAHGSFWNRRLGKFYLYVTDERNLIEIIRTDGRHVFISPDDRSRFVQGLATLLREPQLDGPIP